jgi:formiminotetrahydrofolate cyclodeaminase
LAIQAALAEAARVPLEVVHACAAVLRVCQTAAPLLNAAVISDVMVGAQLAHAGLESAAVNVEINLASMTDAQAVERLSAEVEESRAGMVDLLAEILATARSRIPRR